MKAFKTISNINENLQKKLMVLTVSLEPSLHKKTHSTMPLRKYDK